ncbi:MAG TPA: hypothetical protein DIC45_03465 [Comamonadaceae bacterium]|nr:hypothetical protein [Comamonadaceae bacterium]
MNAAMLQTTMQALPQLRHEGWHRLPGLVVALAGILASYGWWQYQEGVMQSLANARFERQALAAADALQRRVQTKGDLLMGLRGLLMVNPDLPRADFERVAQSLKLDMGHGSVLNLHFTRAVPAAERSAFEVGARADPHVDGSLPSHFTIHPVLDVSEHFVVDFVWPVQGNEQVQGLDIQSQPANVQGYLVARDTGALVVTAPFSMAQEGPGGAAINIRLPVFLPAPPGQQPRFLGAVGALVSISVLVEGMRDRGYLDGLLLSVHDVGLATGAQPQPPQPLYMGDDLSVGSGHIRHDVQVGGRLWRVEIARTQSFLTPQEEHLPAIMAAGALLVTALLTALVALLARRRVQALAHAELASRAARESESRFRAVFNQAAVGMAQVHSAQGGVVRANQRFCELLCYDSEEIASLHMQDVIHPEDLPGNQALLARLIAGEIPEYRLEQRFRRKDGSQVWVDVTVSAMRGGDGPVRYHIVVVQDITERRNTEDELHYLAYNDLLTGLPNRRLLLERIEQACVASQRAGSHGAVLFIDLDHFKTLNDTLGHETGDELLRQVARRLEAGVRAGDLVARLGGDEFVVMLLDLAGDVPTATVQARTVAEQIVALLARPYSLTGQLHHGGASLGVTLFGAEVQTASEVLKQADIAMYEAKARSGNGLCFFDPSMQVALSERARLLADLKRALPAEQFVLHLQPQLDNQGQVAGAEALLRWQHPERGLVPPGQFIAVAEDSELIVPIGRWVLESACRMLARWQDDPALRELCLSVNVSARQFRQPDFVDLVLSSLAASGARAHRLELELTESLVLEDVDDSIAKMHRLRTRGVRFAVDDFGTGYSSLAYLTRLPLQRLKIDRSFVQHLGESHSDDVVVQTILGMARNLALDVVAEGVETQQQCDFLAVHGCEVYQGYLFARPMPVGEFEEYVKGRAR